MSGQVPMLLRLAVMLLPRAIRDEVLGDLAERWHLEVRHRDRGARVRWLLRQPVVVAVARVRFRTLISERAHVSAGRSLVTAIPWLELKLAIRMLLRHPGMSAVAASSLAVGVAATLAGFIVTERFLDPSLPLEDGDRIVAVQLWDMEASTLAPVSEADLVAWRDALTSVRGLGGARLFERNASVGESPGEPIRGAEITPSAFSLAGTAPRLGRPLVSADAEPGAEPVVVIGHDLWVRAFGRDPAALGRGMRLRGTDYTVVGVMPEGFGFPFHESVWIPLRTDEGVDQEGTGLLVFGKLTEGLDLGQAQAEATLLPRDGSPTLRLRVVPFPRALVDVPLPALVGGRALLMILLLVVSGNVGALVYARNLAREGEIAIRSSLGATRRRILAQLLLESLVLSIVAAGLALALAAWAVRLVDRSFLGGAVGLGAVPFWWSDGLPAGSFVLVGVLTLVNVALTGGLPAIVFLRGDVRRRLDRAGAGPTASRLGWPLRVAIATHVTLAVGVLTLALGSWPRMGAQGDAFATLERRSFLTADLRFRADSIESPAESRRELARRLSDERGVTGVAFASRLPSGLSSDVLIEIEGRPVVELPTAHVANVDHRYVPLVGGVVGEGRGLDEGDVEPDGSPRPVVLVTRSLAARRIGAEGVVGHRIRLAHPNRTGPWLEIVGVVDHFGRDVDGPEGIFRPLGAEATAVQVIVGLEGGPAGFAPTLRRVGAEVSSSLRVRRVAPLSVLIAEWRSRNLLGVGAILGAAFLAILLAVGGVHASMSYFVSRRVREVGIRRAMGAGAGRVVRDVFGQAARHLGVGVLLGLLITVPFFAWSLEVGSVNGAVSVAVVVVAAGAIGCLGPTRRILQVPPTDAMREEV